jgi:large subunit ribosomal protein L31
MKKNKHLSVYPTTYKCLSCLAEFQTVSTTFAEGTIRTEVCSNCNTFYTGKLSSEVKTGGVEKFNRRQSEAAKRN